MSTVANSSNRCTAPAWAELGTPGLLAINIHPSVACCNGAQVLQDSPPLWAANKFTHSRANFRSYCRSHFPVLAQVVGELSEG